MKKNVSRRNFMASSVATGFALSVAGNVPSAFGGTTAANSSKLIYPYAVHSDWDFPDLPGARCLTDDGPAKRVSMIVTSESYAVDFSSRVKTYPVFPVEPMTSDYAQNIFKRPSYDLPEINQKNTPKWLWKLLNSKKTFYAASFCGIIIESYWQRFLSSFQMQAGDAPIVKSKKATVGTQVTDVDETVVTSAWSKTLTRSVGAEVGATFKAIGIGLSASIEHSETNSGATTQGHSHSESLAKIEENEVTVTFAPPAEAGVWDFTNWQLVERLRLCKIVFASDKLFTISDRLPPKNAKSAIFPYDKEGGYYTMENHRDIFQTARARQTR